jgi:hypothetical protein
VTRHVEVTGVMWPFVYQLSCLVQIAAQIDWNLKIFFFKVTSLSIYNLSYMNIQ